MSDYDSPWKEALDRFLPAFLEFFFPEVYAAIDWSRGYESLDKELQQIVREGKTGRRVADKLFKVWRRDGEEAWLLIHIEVQNQPEADFPERMFVYYYRIFDQYRRPVISLAVLGDDRPDWRPNCHVQELLGCKIRFEYPMVKLLDYGKDLAMLEKHANPFAALVMAHLKNLETGRGAQERLGWKVRIIKSLYERGLSAEDVRQLFRLIDWMMDLPKELDRLFIEEIQQHEEKKQMPYITSVERLAREEGLEKGREEGLEKGLEKGRKEGILLGRRDDILRILRRRFKKVPKQVRAKVMEIESISQLDALFDQAVACDDLEKFSRALPD